MKYYLGTGVDDHITKYAMEKLAASKFSTRIA